MSTESVADDILRNGFDRWKRLEEEKQAISEDLKELFAELKGNGFDGKALRAAFRVAAKAGDPEVNEHNAIVDLYVTSILGTGNATRSRAARDLPEHDAETGEITEPQVAPHPAQGSDEAAEPVASQPIQPETAEPNFPRVEGIKAPTEAVAADANRGGDNEVVQPENDDIEKTGCGPAEGRREAGRGVSSGAVEAGASLPTIPADFKSDQPTEVVEARMRRTLKMRPGCQRPWSCGRMADQTECAQCLKQAQERAA